MLFTTLCGVVSCAAGGYTLQRSAVTPLQRMRSDIERMSAGDLSGSISASGNDELTAVVQSLRVLQTNVKLLVGQIKESTGVVGPWRAGNRVRQCEPVAAHGVAGERAGRDGLVHGRADGNGQAECR